MEIILEFLSENIIQLILSLGTIILVWLGKPKSAEKLQKLKQKRQAQLKAEIQQTIEKLKLLNKEEEKITKELDNEK